MDKLIDRLIDFFSGKLEYDLDRSIRQTVSLHSRYEAGELTKEEARVELEIIKQRVYGR